MPKKNSRAEQIKKKPTEDHKYGRLYNILMPAVFLTMIFMITTFNISGDDDIFWHLETGKYITLNKTIPSADVFGLTTSGSEWIPFEWGFDVLYYNIYSVGGYTAISILRSLIFAAIFYLVFRLTFKLKLNYSITGIILLLLTAAIFERFLIKPQIISYLFTAIILYIFLKYSFLKRTGNKLLYFLPAVFLIWANMHMGVLLGLVLFAIFIISELIKILKPGFELNTADPVTKSNFTKLLVIFAVSALMLLVNPHGIRTYIYVYSHLQMKMIGEVYEWYSPFNNLFAGTMYIYIYYIYILLTLGGIYLSFKNKIFFPGIAFAVFLLFSFKATRYSIDFMLISSVLMIAVFSYSLNAAKIRVFNNVYPVLISLIIASAIIILLPGSTLYSMFNYDRIFGTSVDKIYYPVNAAEFSKQNNIITPDSRVFNSFENGGYLIWKLSGAKNFIDSRNLNDDIYFTYKMINNKQHGFEQKLSSLNFDVVFWSYTKLPWNSSELNTSILSYLFKNNGSWKLVYWDDNSFIFVKNNERYKDVIEKYEYKYVNPYYYIFDKTPLQNALTSDPGRVTSEIKRSLNENPDGVFTKSMAKSFGITK